MSTNAKGCRTVKRWMMVGLIAGAHGGLLACSVATTEADQPGSCSLSCSNPTVPGYGFTIEPLLQVEGLERVCEADFTDSRVAALNGPIQVKYIVKKPAGDAGNEGGAAEPEALQDASSAGLPVPGIGFEPYVVGGVAADKSNEEFTSIVDGKVVVTPFKYAGIVTPRAEWCSDSCGVMTYEVWPVCIEGGENKITAGIVSGGIQSKPLEIVVTNGTDEEE